MYINPQPAVRRLSLLPSVSFSCDNSKWNAHWLFNKFLKFYTHQHRVVHFHQIITAERVMGKILFAWSISVVGGLHELGPIPRCENDRTLLFIDSAPIKRWPHDTRTSSVSVFVQAGTFFDILAAKSTLLRQHEYGQMVAWIYLLVYLPISDNE